MGHAEQQRMERLTNNSFADLEVPEVLEASIERHRLNLARLVRTLQSAGIGEEEIEISVSLLLKSYRRELVSAIRSMVR